MALSFDETNGYLTLATPLISAVPIVASFWIRHPISSTTHWVFSIQDPPAGYRFNYWKLSVTRDSEKRTFQINGGSSANMTGTNDELGDSDWHHVLLWSNTTSDHGTYLNAGSKVSTATTATPDPTETIIFANKTGSDNFLGELAELAFWDASIVGRELKFAEALATGYSPAFFPEGLISYFPLISDMRDTQGTNWVWSGTLPAVFDHPVINYPGDNIIPFPPAVAGGLSIPIAAYHYNHHLKP